MHDVAERAEVAHLQLRLEQLAKLAEARGEGSSADKVLKKILAVGLGSAIGAGAGFGARHLLRRKAITDIMAGRTAFKRHLPWLGGIVGGGVAVGNAGRRRAEDEYMAKGAAVPGAALVKKLWQGTTLGKMPPAAALGTALAEPKNILLLTYPLGALAGAAAGYGVDDYLKKRGKKHEKDAMSTFHRKLISRVGIPAALLATLGVAHPANEFRKRVLKDRARIEDQKKVPA